MTINLDSTPSMAGEMESDLQETEQKLTRSEKEHEAQRSANEELVDEMSLQAKHYAGELEAKEEALIEVAEAMLESNLETKKLRNQIEKLKSDLAASTKLVDDTAHEKEVRCSQLLAEAAAAQERLERVEKEMAAQGLAEGLEPKEGAVEEVLTKELQVERANSDRLTKSSIELEGKVAKLARQEQVTGWEKESVEKEKAALEERVGMLEGQNGRLRVVALRMVMDAMHTWDLEVISRRISVWRGRNFTHREAEKKAALQLRHTVKALERMASIMRDAVTQDTLLRVFYWTIQASTASHVRAAQRASLVGLSKILAARLHGESRKLYRRFVENYQNDTERDRAEKLLIKRLKPVVHSWVLRRRIRKLVAMARDSKCSDKNLKHMRERVYVVRETIESEEKYVAVLHEILVLFLLPIRDMMMQDSHHWGKATARKREEFLMFLSSVEEMCMHHTLYLDSLNATTTRVGADGDLSGVFLRIAAGIESTYHTYLNRMLPIQKTLQAHMKKDPEFVEFLTKQSKQSKICPGNGFASFLIQPLQRFVAYATLLDRIVHLTPDEDVHKGNMIKALDVLRLAQASVDDRQAEYRKLALMQQMLTTNYSYVTEGRSLVSETKAKQITERRSTFSQRSEMAIRLYLLSDYLLITTPISEHDDDDPHDEKVPRVAGGFLYDVLYEMPLEDVAVRNAETDHNKWKDEEAEIEEWLVLTLSASEESGLKEDAMVVINFLGGVVEKNAWKSSLETAQLADAKHSEASIGFNKSESMRDLLGKKSESDAVPRSRNIGGREAELSTVREDSVEKGPSPGKKPNKGKPAGRRRLLVRSKSLMPPTKPNPAPVVEPAPVPAPAKEEPAVPSRAKLAKDSRLARAVKKKTVADGGKGPGADSNANTQEGLEPKVPTKEEVPPAPNASGSGFGLALVAGGGVSPNCKVDPSDFA